jgi:L-alanine-DL-glutamate epimerase-like enolase superfamily enzyme
VPPSFSLQLHPALGSVAGWHSARGSWSHREGWWLQVRDASGATGLGLYAPLPGYSAESSHSGRRVLHRLMEQAGSGLEQQCLQLCGLLGELGPRPSPRALLSALLTGLRPMEALSEVVEHPAVGTALGAALMDLAARRVGLPLLCPPEGALVTCAEVVGLRELLGRLNDFTPARVFAAAAAEASPPRCYKLKVGLETPAIELPLLRQLRHRLHPETKLRLDANGAWLPGNAETMLSQLQELDIEVLEEPWTEPLHLLQLRSPIPIAWDESLQRADCRDLLSAAQTQGLRAIVLKPMALGLLQSLRLLDEATTLKLEVIPSHLLDGDFGIALGLLLERLRGSCELVSGLGSGAGDWGVGGNWVRRSGEVRVAASPGLGLKRENQAA